MLNRRLFLRYSSTLAGTVCLSTSLTGCGRDADPTPHSQIQFTHGIASGDPATDAVMLWTRAKPVRDSELAVTLGWELAEDPGFSQLLRSGTVSTDSSRDFTVKIDVQELTPGRDYYYRFIGAENYSPIGRTRTLPSGSPQSVRLAVFSCSNYPAGYFHAYREASRLENVDAFIHLGDYIYEYGEGGYATERAAELGRELPADNSGELLSLEDYRRRYALYRSDEDLQAVHATGPMILVWDDHEIANDCWREGAQNHNPGEGDFEARRAAAVQAYFEWMPLRPPKGDGEDAIFRSFDFGDLLSLHMLDTRLIGRDEQLEYAQFMDAESGALRAEDFLGELSAVDRSMLGDEQRQWIGERLSNSPGRWQVLGQQVLMARMNMPAKLLQTLATRDPAEAQGVINEFLAVKMKAVEGGPLSEQETALLSATLPYNLDAWDGYPAEREKLYAQARRAGRPLVVLAGDTHNAWTSRLHDADGNALGIELATPAVSSPGMESYLKLDDAAATGLARALPALIDELDYCELRSRGFLDVVFTAESVQATWHLFDSVHRRDYQVVTEERRFSA